MFATKALRQAAAHAERVPSIKFLGKRSIPAAVDHSPQPHPASPAHVLPPDFVSARAEQSSHRSFTEYRQRSQQYGPLRKSWTRRKGDGIGAAAAADLPSIEPTKGTYFDRSQLPAQYRRSTYTAEEIEAIESGGASLAS